MSILNFAAFVLMALLDEHIVWGTSDTDEHIVWGTTFPGTPPGPTGFD